MNTGKRRRSRPRTATRTAISGGKGPRHRGAVGGRELSGAGVPGRGPAAPGCLRWRQRRRVSRAKGSLAGDVWKGVKSGCKTLCQRFLGDPDETGGFGLQRVSMERRPQALALSGSASPFTGGVSVNWCPGHPQGARLSSWGHWGRGEGAVTGQGHQGLGFSLNCQRSHRSLDVWVQSCS